MNTKKLVVRIICFAVMAVISAALIFGNIMAFENQDVITSVLSGTGEDYSGAREELKNGDALCKQIAEESITLLRNEKVAGNKNALPLDSSVTQLNVFGYGSTDKGFLMKGVGSGSSTINEAKKITFLEGLTGVVRDFDIDESEYTFDGVKDNDLLADLKEAFGEELVRYDVNEEILNIYNDFANSSATDKDRGTARPNQNDLVINDDSGKAYRLDEPAKSLFTDEVMTNAADYSDVAIFVISRDGGENIGEQPKTQTVGGKVVSDRTYMDITSQEEDMLKLLNKYFGTTIVVLNTTNTMHLGFLEDETLGVDACLYVGLPGQSGARAIPEILSGKVNPSGKFTDIVTRSSAVAKKYDPTYVNSEASGYQIHYVEDIYYGYKWYETADKEGFFSAKSTSYDDVVTYPFGHGLSYSEFEERIEKISYKDGDNEVVLSDNSSIDGIPVDAEITVSVKVTNKGSVAGKDVVELYYTPEYKKNGVEKAEINLLAFGKTGNIAPNDTHTINITFDLYSMASYDCYNKNGAGAGYILEDGFYDIKLMKNSHELIEKRTLNLGETVHIEKDPATKVLVANRFTGENAYAGLSVDGKEAGVSQKWLSRADFSGTFPTQRSSGHNNGGKVNSAANYVNDAPYQGKDRVSDGTDAGIYLWTKDGVKATMEELKGQKESSITPDYELLAELSDYESKKWDQFLKQMTVKEMKTLIEQGGFGRTATVSVGLREMYDYDGPAGFNANSRGATSGEWTAYPSEALIGCSWNEQLMFLMGRAMGAEANATAIHGWYAPGVNLHRSNYNSRNFEYYSEDAVLSGKLAVQVIAGAKTNGLVCYLKHFACSEEGPNPRDVNTWLTEQNLRENYLKPFEIAVKGIDVDLSVTDETTGEVTENSIHVGANAIMTAFNRVGASWAGSNYSLNVSVLREEWGFKGTVITDWTTIASWGSSDGIGSMNTHQGIRCGNDLWLDPNYNNRSLELDNPIDRYCAEICSKNILYTVADTFTTYDKVVKSGAQLDNYQTTLSDKFKNVTSWWQPVLITVDCLVAVGFVIWGVSLFVPLNKLFKKKGTDNGETVDD